jgi:hypothetical protein
MTRGRKRDLTEILNFISATPCGATKNQVAEFLGVRPEAALDYMQILKSRRLICTVGHSHQLRWASAVNFEATVLAWSRSRPPKKVRNPIQKTAASESSPPLSGEMIRRIVPADKAPRPQIGRTSVFDV